MNGRPASVASAVLFYIFLPFLLAHYIHISNHYFHRQNALNKDSLEQIIIYRSIFFSLQKAVKNFH